jgi:hypothetical protein
MPNGLRLSAAGSVLQTWDLRLTADDQGGELLTAIAE